MNGRKPITLEEALKTIPGVTQLIAEAEYEFRKNYVPNFYCKHYSIGAYIVCQQQCQQCIEAVKKRQEQTQQL